MHDVTDHLSALDATFLELEQGDTSAHMHIGAVFVFDPGPGGGPPPVDDLLVRLARRLDRMPHGRERLSEPRVHGLRRPAWVAAEPFDLDAHVHRAALPAPGGETELLDWAADFFSHRLDRRLPLWEVALVEGLAGGRWALVTKIHHCLVDGVGSSQVTDLLLDEIEPASERAPVHEPWLPVHLASAGLDVIRRPRRALGQWRGLLELAIRDEVVPAPPASINVAIGEHRRLVAVRTSLADVRAIRAAFGGTVNDVLLGAVAGGLRALLLSRGETPPSAGLRAMLPVDVRAPGALTPGNQVSSLFVALPAAQDDPLERHRELCEHTAAAKAGRGLEGATALLSAGEFAPPVLHALMAQPTLGRRLFNLTVTNVPGPPATVHAFGARLREIVPLVPLAADHAVGVAIVSYDGLLTIGLNCDRGAVPDVAVLAGGIEASLADLHALATVPAPS